MRNDDEDDPLGFDLFNGDPPLIDSHARPRLPRHDGVEIVLTVILGAILTVAVLGAFFR